MAFKRLHKRLTVFLIAFERLLDKKVRKNFRIFNLFCNFAGA